MSAIKDFTGVKGAKPSKLLEDRLREVIQAAPDPQNDGPAPPRTTVLHPKEANLQGAGPSPTTRKSRTDKGFQPLLDSERSQRDGGVGTSEVATTTGNEQDPRHSLPPSPDRPEPDPEPEKPDQTPEELERNEMIQANIAAMRAQLRPTSRRAR